MTSLNNLWQEYGPALKYFICRRVSDEGLVEDIFQDVMVKVQSRLDDLRDPTRLKSWIYQICRYTIIDHYRRRKITAESPDNLVTATEMEEAQFRRALDFCIQEMVEKLPFKYRQAVMLTTYEGLTQKEMGEHLGLSVSGAKSRVQRAREKLKTELLDCCQIELDRFGKIIDYTPKIR